MSEFIVFELVLNCKKEVKKLDSRRNKLHRLNLSKELYLFRSLSILTKTFFTSAFEHNISKSVQFGYLTI